MSAYGATNRRKPLADGRSCACATNISFKFRGGTCIFDAKPPACWDERAWGGNVGAAGEDRVYFYLLSLFIYFNYY